MLEYSPRYGFVNDFTIIEKDGVYHLFHITGERRKYFGKPVSDALNHVGHATSTDLVNWTEQPIVTGFSGACFCLEHEGRYAILSRLQKISWSENLFDWSDPEPIHFDYTGFEDFYETEVAKDMTKGVYFCPRDPFVWRDEDNNRYLMFFCTRTLSGEIYTRGCVGLAESENLTEWKILEPALGSGKHFFTESPHVVDLGGKYHMIYHLSSECGLRHAVSESLTGPYQEVETMDLLPAYLGASETLKVGDDWYFFGRTVERAENDNRIRLCKKSLGLPLKLETGNNDRIIFRELPFLKDLRDENLFCSENNKMNDFWHVVCGDWRINQSPAMAANRHQPIPQNSLYGSANFTPGAALFDRPCRNFDIEFDLQIPSFNGNDSQQRGGFTADGITFKLDSFQKALFCHDADREILAFKTFSYVKNDKYYHFRIFRNDNMTQVFVDGELIMYLPAYGDGSGKIGFVVDHADIIVKDISIWSLKVEDFKGFTLDNPQGETMNGIYY